MILKSLLAKVDIMKITRRQLRRIIRESYESMLANDHIDGQPWSGSFEDLASVQSKTWGHGAVVDPKGWEKSVDLAKHWTRGTARSASAQNLNERGTGNPALSDAERSLVRAVINWVDQYRLVMSMDPNDYGDDRRVRRTLNDIIGGLIE